MIDLMSNSSKYFLEKTKQNGNLCSVVHVWKYKDAILWGAKVTKCVLPSSFYLETERFLNLLKKEVKKAVKDIVGEVNRLRSLSPLWEMAQEGVDISKIEWAHH